MKALQLWAQLPCIWHPGNSLVFPGLISPPWLLLDINKKWSCKCSHCQSFKKRWGRGWSGDKANPRIADTVKCKDNLRIAVKPKSFNAWLWNGSWNWESLLVELLTNTKMNLCPGDNHQLLVLGGQPTLNIFFSWGPMWTIHPDKWRIDFKCQVMRNTSVVRKRKKRWGKKEA